MLAIVMFAVGVQFLLMGLLAEMLVRTYHESQAKAIYAVRERSDLRTTNNIMCGITGWANLDSHAPPP